MTPLLSNMSPDDMRVAMAEVAGLVDIGSGNKLSEYHISELPNYLNSLDAVALVEARLTDSQREHVIEILMGDAERPLWKQVADAAFATALQRTKAILLATGKATL